MFSCLLSPLPLWAWSSSPASTMANARTGTWALLGSGSLLGPAGNCPQVWLSVSVRLFTQFLNQCGANTCVILNSDCVWLFMCSLFKPCYLIQYVEHSWWFLDNFVLVLCTELLCWLKQFRLVYHWLECLAVRMANTLCAYCGIREAEWIPVKCVGPLCMEPEGDNCYAVFRSQGKHVVVTIRLIRLWNSKMALIGSDMTLLPMPLQIPDVKIQIAGYMWVAGYESMDLLDAYLGYINWLIIELKACSGSSVDVKIVYWNKRMAPTTKAGKDAYQSYSLLTRTNMLSSCMGNWRFWFNTAVFCAQSLTGLWSRTAVCAVSLRNDSLAVEIVTLSGERNKTQHLHKLQRTRGGIVRHSHDRLTVFW